MTMITFSFATSLIDSSSSARHSVEWAIEHGFGGVEFNAPNIRLSDVSSDDRQFLVAMAGEHGLRYTHHFPSTASPGSHDSVRRESDLKELINEIKAAADIGVEVIVVHPGKLHVNGLEPEDVSESDRTVSLTHFVEFMRATAPAAEDAGVVIGAENMHYIPGWLIQTHGELADAIDAIGSPAVGVTFDVGHAWGSGGVENGIRILGDRIRHVQVHDARGPEGAGNVKDQHLEIGTGVLDFGPIGDLVKSNGFICTLETSGIRDDREAVALRSRDALQKMWD